MATVGLEQEISEGRADEMRRYPDASRQSHMYRQRKKVVSLQPPCPVPDLEFVCGLVSVLGEPLVK